MRSSHRLLAAVAGVAAAALILACGSGGSGSGSGSGGEPAKDAAAPTLALGGVQEFKDGPAKVKVVVSAVDKNARSSNQFDKSERGQFVAATVEVTAVDGDTDIGPSNFRFIASDGTVYKAKPLVVGIDPPLDAMTTIHVGQRKTGKVVFDCEAAKIEGGKIEVSADGGKPVAYWTI